MRFQIALLSRLYDHCFQIPTTITRILLNHFRWDKEKLMERFYDGDQDQLFSEARVVNPFKKLNISNRLKVKMIYKNYNDYNNVVLIATKKNVHRYRGM